jgi:RNA polymerase sigma factor (sigma-70 family)
MDLLALMRQGDKLALKELFDRHYIDLCQQARVRLKNAWSDADDIVQQVFIDFWTQKKFEVVQENVKGYLARMMHFKTASFVRSEARKKVNLHKYLDSHKEISSIDPTDENRNALITLLHNQINRLPQQCREVFIAAYMEEKTYQEVADEMGITKNTVKSHMKTAMAKLKTALKDFTPLLILFFLAISPFYKLLSDCLIDG